MASLPNDRAMPGGIEGGGNAPCARSRRGGGGRRPIDDRRGAVAVVTAIVLLVLLGFASLGTEVVYLMFTARRMQSAADSAALGAVAALIQGYPASYADQAYALAGAQGFVTGQDNTAVAINNPPTSGGYAGQSGAVEVMITRSEVPVLAHLFRGSPFVLVARSVAKMGSYGACVLALDPTASASFSIAGSLVANFSSCWVADNSSAAQAVSVAGGATVNAAGIRDVGGYSQSKNSTINAAGGIETDADATDDPYAGVAVPEPSVCSATNYAIANYAQQTIMPGTYCGGISVSGGASLTLSPGVYVIDQGALSIAGGSTVTGSAVTIVLTSSTGSNYATVSIAGGATVNLTPPTSGSTAGLVFFQDPRAPASGTDYLTGGSGQTIMGAIYFPNQTVSFSGATKNQCTEIIGRTVTIAGGSNLAADCAGTGVKPIVVQLGQLVE